MKNILVTGSKGMLGHDLVETLEKHGYFIIPVDIDLLDITDKSSVDDYFDDIHCDLVIHTAAYTDVDGAELNQNLAYKINYHGTQNLAEATARFEIPIVYISTDYVFNGKKSVPYETKDAPDPLNIYGMTKLKGEEVIKDMNYEHYIVRTSWLYGLRGRNFVETIINLAREKSELKIITDQIGCPTWTNALIEGIIELIKNNKPYGTYHICGSGYTSWFDFAAKIIDLMNIDTKLIPVATDEFPRPAKRPGYSALSNNGICPDWQESLSQYIDLREKR